MTKKQVWRYECEFCGKKGLSAGHMKAHEASCTANPARVCRMHVNYALPQKPMPELRAALNTNLPDCGLKALRELTDNCPMCILATIRQSGAFKWDGDPESPPPTIDFDFKAEVKSAWDTINDAKAVEEDRHHEFNYYG